MAIEGLKSTPQPSEVNINDQVGASVEALNMLGLVEDRDQVTESIAAEFKALDQTHKVGERFVQLPRSAITLSEMVTALDGSTYPEGRSYPQTYVYGELWTPGFNKDGYTAEELDNLTLERDGNFAPHARLAVHNPASKQEPLLHFLGQPYDEKYAEKGQQTQLEAVDEAVAAYEVIGHEDFEMTPLNAKAVAMIALMRRIKGEAMPLSWGYMRDATLPRKTVGGNSVVGRVVSYGGRLGFRGSDGRAASGSGVGLSVGPKELEPQAS